MSSVLSLPPRPVELALKAELALPFSLPWNHAPPRLSIRAQLRLAPAKRVGEPNAVGAESSSLMRPAAPARARLLPAGRCRYHPGMSPRLRLMSSRARDHTDATYGKRRRCYVITSAEM